jgi:fructokinase
MGEAPTPDEGVRGYVSVHKQKRMDHLPTVVGLGEILWDLLPSGRQLGGAPANFAYCSHLLGERAVVASRTGMDDLGKEARESMLGKGITDQFLQTDPSHATGTVRVHLDEEGQPRFEITEPVAWDFLEWTPTWQALGESADAVCFGTLAQRSPQSHRTIVEFLRATQPKALRVFDVNLRQNFYTSEIISDSLSQANVVKLNQEEVPRVRDLLRVNSNDELSFCREVVEKFKLQLMCITRGSNGSLLCDQTSEREHPGFRIQVKDTVGAGDAFTAALVSEYLRGASLAEINDSANRMGAWVASSAGAMPPPGDGLPQKLAEFHLK